MWKHILNGALTAALSGGASACGALALDPEHFGLAHLQHLGMVFAAGAIFGVINWLRAAPWQIAIDPTAAQLAQRYSQKEPTP